MKESKRLYRQQSDGVLGGVCAGLARYTSVDAGLIRAVFVILTLVNGLGILLYMLLWAIIPDRSRSELGGETAIEANIEDMVGRIVLLAKSVRGNSLAGVLLVACGVVFLLNTLTGIGLAILVPLALIGIGIYLVVSARPHG